MAHSCQAADGSSGSKTRRPPQLVDQACTYRCHLCEENRGCIPGRGRTTGLCHIEANTPVMRNQTISGPRSRGDTPHIICATLCIFMRNSGERSCAWKQVKAPNATPFGGSCRMRAGGRVEPALLVSGTPGVLLRVSAETRKERATIAGSGGGPHPGEPAHDLGHGSGGRLIIPRLGQCHDSLEP